MSHDFYSKNNFSIAILKSKAGFSINHSENCIMGVFVRILLIGLISIN